MALTNAKDIVEWITIAIYETHSQKTIVRYTFETAVLATNEEDVTASSLAALDNALRAHLCRILGGFALPESVESSLNAKVKDTEKTFDFVVGTKGVRANDKWMPAHGKERRELSANDAGADIDKSDSSASVLTVPIKDADSFSVTAQIRSRLEFVENKT